MKTDVNLDPKALLAQLVQLLGHARRYAKFAYFVFLAIIFGFLVFRINSLVQAEPSDDAVAEKLQTVQRPHIDEDVLAKIQQLQGQNVEVKSLFQQARDNPFSE